jgi:hypothetical protein
MHIPDYIAIGVLVACLGARWWFFRDVTHDGREAVCGHLLASSG